MALRFREIPAAQRSAGVTAEMVRDREGTRLLKAVPDSAWLIALDEHGTGWSSTELAGEMQNWLARHPQVMFMIGGADGLAESCRQRANSVWSLSPLTLPHALVRVVLAEQLYRAWTLVQGHPYHRE